MLASFGDNALNQTYPMIRFTPAFTSVYPTEVSTYGGELITLKASGFNATLLETNAGKSFESSLPCPALRVIRDGSNFCA